MEQPAIDGSWSDGTGAVVLIAFGLIAVFASSTAGWWYGLVFRPLMKAQAAGSPYPLTALLALQFSSASSVILLLYADAASAFWSFLFPFLDPVGLIMSPSAKKSAVLSHYHTAVWAGFTAGIAIVGSFCVVSFRALRFALLPSLVIAAVTTVYLAEARALERMTSRATELGATCLARHSFSESLGFWGEDLQWDLHASARIDGKRHGWSYVQDDFYLIPDAAPKDGNGLQAECKAQERVS